MSWDAQRDMPDKDVAVELLQLGAVDILLRMHDRGEPGAAWACLLNLLCIDPYYFSYDSYVDQYEFGTVVLQVLRGTTSSQAKNKTVRYLAKLPKGTFGVLGSHFCQIRGEVATRLFTSTEPLSAVERQLFERALENMS